MLGGHVGQAAGDRLTLRFAGFTLRDTEVDDLDEVVRLDIAVDDVVLVRVLEPFRALDDDVEFLN